jgi:hypothetical protein
MLLSLYIKGTSGVKTEAAPAAGNYTKFNYNGKPLPPGVDRQEGHECFLIYTARKIPFMYSFPGKWPYENSRVRGTFHLNIVK